jgi:hypothetical protein
MLTKENLQKIANRFKFVYVMHGGITSYNPDDWDARGEKWVTEYYPLLNGSGCFLCEKCINRNLNKEECKLNLNKKDFVLISLHKEFSIKGRFSDRMEKQLRIKELKVMPFKDYPISDPFCFIEGCENFLKRKIKK